MRIQTNLFFDTLLKNIKDNNDAIENLKHNAFSTKNVDDMSIKSRQNENDEIVNALISLYSVIPKDITHRVVQSIISKPMYKMYKTNVEGIEPFDLEFIQFISPYPDVYDHPEIIVNLSNICTYTCSTTKHKKDLRWEKYVDGSSGGKFVEI